MIHVVEYSKEAKLCAELAKKHALEAEMNAERIAVELKRFDELCNSDLDNESMQTIKQIVMAARDDASFEPSKKLGS